MFECFGSVSHGYGSIFGGQARENYTFELMRKGVEAERMVIVNNTFMNESSLDVYFKSGASW